MKKILILEDDNNFIRYINNIITEISNDIVVYGFNNVKDAYLFSLENTICLFIVDIILDEKQVGDTSGLYFIDNIRKVRRYEFSPVIIVTSLMDEKLYSYEKLHCYSFMEKPFEPELFKSKVKECLNFPMPINENKTLYFRDNGVILAIDIDDIIYVESVMHILHIHTFKGGNVNIRYHTLKWLLNKADNSDILQCSRNTIINKKYIENIDYARSMIKMRHVDNPLSIGISYKNSLKKFFV